MSAADKSGASQAARGPRVNYPAPVPDHLLSFYLNKVTYRCTTVNDRRIETQLIHVAHIYRLVHRVSAVLINITTAEYGRRMQRGRNTFAHSLAVT